MGDDRNESQELDLSLLLDAGERQDLRNNDLDPADFTILSLQATHMETMLGDGGKVHLITMVYLLQRGVLKGDSMLDTRSSDLLKDKAAFKPPVRIVIRKDALEEHVQASLRAQLEQILKSTPMSIVLPEPAEG